MINLIPHLARTVDTAIADNLEGVDRAHAVVPVRNVAQVVMNVSGASAGDFPAILHLVCERSIKRGHVLEFSGTVGLKMR